MFKMNTAYCTPESSPISDHGGIDMSTSSSNRHPIDCSQTSLNESNNMVLDLCVRRTSTTTVPIESPISPNRNHESPRLSFTTATSPIVTPYLVNQNYPYLMHHPQIKQEMPQSPRAPSKQIQTSSPRRDFVESSEKIDRSQPTSMMVQADTTVIPNMNSTPNNATVAALFNGFGSNNSLMKCTTRPFKAYPKDPSILLANEMGGQHRVGELLLNQESRESYTEFRRHMLAQVNINNNNIMTGVSNPKMRRNSRNSDNNSENGSGEKDAAYWERRRKNNEAAKRSRDARRAKEDEIAIRAAFLEHENMRLKIECAALRDELNELRTLINVHN